MSLAAFITFYLINISLTCQVTNTLMYQHGKSTQRQVKPIEVMELDGYNRWTCNKLSASSHDTWTIKGVIHKLDVEELHRQHH